MSVEYDEENQLKDQGEDQVSVLYDKEYKVTKDCNAKDYIGMVLKAKEAMSETNNYSLSSVQSTDNICNSPKIILKNGFPREVKLWSFISRVTDISTRNTSFNVFFTLSASWIETEPKEKITLNDTKDGHEIWKLADFGWYPQLRFLNIIEEDNNFQDEWFRVVPECQAHKPGISRGSLIDYKKEFRESHENNEPMRVTQFMKKKLTLAEYFELENFPVDLQSLHIQVSTSWDCHNVLLRFCDTNTISYEPKALDSQEFELHDPRLISYNTKLKDDDLPLLSDADHSITGVRYSRAYIALTVTRKDSYYTWNLSLMLTILGTLSFTLFGTGVKFTVERLGNLFTLILAIIAYKIVLANDLPHVSSLTMLDKFTIFSIGILVIISAGMAINHSLFDTDEPVPTDNYKCFDKWLFYATGILWIGLNLWYYIRLWFLRKKRGEKVDEIKKDFKSQRKKVEKTCLSLRCTMIVNSDNFMPGSFDDNGTDAGFP